MMIKKILVYISCLALAVTWAMKDEEQVDALVFLKAEVAAMKRQMDSMQSELSACLEIRESLRKAENSHVTMHWMQQLLKDLETEVREFSSSLQNVTESSQKTNKFVTDQLESVKMETRSLATSLKAMDIRLEKTLFRFKNIKSTGNPGHGFDLGHVTKRKVRQELTWLHNKVDEIIANMKESYDKDQS